MVRQKKRKKKTSNSPKPEKKPSTAVPLVVTGILIVFIAVAWAYFSNVALAKTNPETDTKTETDEPLGKDDVIGDDILNEEVMSSTLPSHIEVHFSEINEFGDSVKVVEDTSIHVIYLLSGKSIIGGKFNIPGTEDQSIFTGFAIIECVQFVKMRSEEQHAMDALDEDSQTGQDIPIPDQSNEADTTLVGNDENEEYKKEIFQPDDQAAPTRALVLGLGVGLLVEKLTASVTKVDVVEIDNSVVRAANSHFFFQRANNLYIQDALEFVTSRQIGGDNENQEVKYDIIVHDLYSGGENLLKSLSVEFLRDLKHLLAENGVLVVNFVGFYVGEHLRLGCSIANGLRSLFSVVHCFADHELDELSHLSCNLVCFCADAEFEFSLPQDYLGDTLEYSVFWVAEHFQEWPVLQDSTCESAEVHQMLKVENLEDFGGAATAITAAQWEQVGDVLPEEIWNS